MAACHVGRQPGAGAGQRRATPAPSPSGRSPAGRTVLDDRRAAGGRAGVLGAPSRRSWGTPRETRWRPAAPGDRTARRRSRPTRWCAAPTRDDLDVLYPACVAMYTEEVGVSPGVRRRRRALPRPGAQLVNRGWSFARFEDGRVVFKAEVACASPYAARSRASGSPRTAAARGWPRPAWPRSSSWCAAEIAPVVSLYVNECNVPARRAYDRAGFRQTGTLLHRHVLRPVRRTRAVWTLAGPAAACLCGAP